MRLCQIFNHRHAANAIIALLLLTACTGPRNEDSTAHEPVDNAVVTEPAHPAASADGVLPAASESEGVVTSRSDDAVVQARATRKGEILEQRLRHQTVLSSVMPGKMAADTLYGTPYSMPAPVEPLDRENYAHVTEPGATGQRASGVDV